MKQLLHKCIHIIIILKHFEGRFLLCTLNYKQKKYCKLNMIHFNIENPRFLIQQITIRLNAHLQIIIA